MDFLEASTLQPDSEKEKNLSVRIPAFTVIFHPKIERVGERASLAPLNSGRRITLSRLEPLFAGERRGEPRPLGDPYLSRSPIFLRSARGGGIEVIRQGEKTLLRVNGTSLGERLMLSSAEIQRGAVFEMANSVVLLLHELEPRSGRGPAELGLVGTSSSMGHLHRQIRRAAAHDAPDLLRGETGTGKELVAKAIHQTSARRSGPYVTMNMSAVSRSLAAAELFGVSRGAYTGADRERRGFFARADGGTLFLDEIGETPHEMQPMMLRALESGEIQPVGSARILSVSVRLIAATDADLEQAIKSGRFRAPLLHRLAGTVIRLPTLRERREDIGLLLRHFLVEGLEQQGWEESLLTEADRLRDWLPARVVARLAAFDWPGNVRQLRHVAGQLAILAGTEQSDEVDGLVGELVGIERFECRGPSELASPRSHRSETKSYRQPFEVSEDELKETLRNHGFRLKPTAEALGVSRTALYKLIDRCPGVRRASQIDHEELEACWAKHDGDLESMAQELEISFHGLRRRMRELRIRKG